MVDVGTTNFPASVDSHANGDPFGFARLGDGLRTQLSQAESDTATTLNVVDNTDFHTRGLLSIGTPTRFEIVSYTGKNGTTQFTGVTRGIGLTSGLTHVDGSAVAQVPTAANLNDLAAALDAVENELIKRRPAELIANSNLDHFQRGTGARTATTTYNKETSFAADRFFARPSGASITVQRSTTVPDSRSRYSALLTGAASVTTVDYGQRIGAGIVNTSGLQSLVFSAYVRNVSGAAFTPNLRIGTPASADDFTSTTNRLDQALQQCADNAWTRVYHVFDPSGYTNIANGMEVCLRVPSGSLVSGDTVYIAQFSLRPGIALAAYVPPDPDLELLRCLPYCRILGANSNGTYNAATRILVSSVFDPPMRAAPIATLLNSAFQILEVGVGFQTGSGSTIFGSALQVRGSYLDIDGFAGLTAGSEIRIVSADVASFSAEFP